MACGFPLAEGLAPADVERVKMLTRHLAMIAARCFQEAEMSVAEAGPLMDRALAGALVATTRATAMTLGQSPEAAVETVIDLIREAAAAHDAEQRQAAGGLN